jgi:hypothetical protein
MTMGIYYKGIFGSDLLSHSASRAVPSALKTLTSVFGMGTGVSSSPLPPKIRYSILTNPFVVGTTKRSVKFYICGQASRPISTGKLNTLLCLHTRPINLVVFKGSLDDLPKQTVGISHLEVGFPLRCFQRLSHPNLATQLCRWHDNWNTIGSSIPVLSY